MEYNSRALERKWQDRWQKDKIFEVDVNSIANKFYILVMFPYPSGDRLHMGHWYQYGVMDTWARFQGMQGRNVFFPMGFDDFGLPAENFAIKHGMHPDTSTAKNVAYMLEQFQRMGVRYTGHTKSTRQNPTTANGPSGCFSSFVRRASPIKSVDR